MLSDWTIHAVGSLHMGNVARAPYARVNVLTGFFPSLPLSFFLSLSDTERYLSLCTCLPAYLSTLGLMKSIDCPSGVCRDVSNARCYTKLMFTRSTKAGRLSLCASRLLLHEEGIISTSPIPSHEYLAITQHGQACEKIILSNVYH